VAERKAATKVEVAIHKFYVIEDNKVTRIRRDCPRCGKGVFMAQHKDRHTCGKCGFTEFTHKEQIKKSSKKSNY
jgi:ubiquitin-small subunit ribosomal protein S27Ae